MGGCNGDNYSVLLVAIIDRPPHQPAKPRISDRAHDLPKIGPLSIDALREVNYTDLIPVGSRHEGDSNVPIEHKVSQLPFGRHGVLGWHDRVGVAESVGNGQQSIPAR